MPLNSAKPKNFEFSNMITKWLGYNSANDPTNIAENVVTRGSLNVYKKINGNWATRFGLKRQGEANETLSPVSSEFVWNTSWGRTLPLWVSDSKLQVRFEDVWYSLLTGLTTTRWVFDKWYDPTQAKDTLLGVNGTSTMYSWSGGITDIASGSNASGGVAQLALTPTVAGTGYVVGEVLTITTGGTGATAEVLSVGTGAVLTVSAVGTGLGGTGYAVGNVLQLNGGDIASKCLVTVATIGAGGAVATVTVTNSGIGYSATNYTTTNLSGGTGKGAIITVATVSAGGSVTEVRLITPGSGYTTGTGKVTTASAAGTGATLNISVIATGSITKSDTSTTFLEDGFAQAGVINVGGTEYTYNYVTDFALVGVSPNPSAIAAGVGFNKVETHVNTPAVNFNADFLKVVNNQVYVGSYTSRNCYISNTAYYTDYVVLSPRLPGGAEFLTLDSTLNGIGVRQGNAWISYGSGEWAEVSFQDITVGTTLTQQTHVDPKPVAKLAAAYAHEFIGVQGDNIVYLAKDQQVRTLGDFNNSFVSAYPSLSQEISTELMAEDFTNGGLKCIGDFTYVTSPVSGKTYLNQVRQAVDSNNQVIVERLWHAPFTLNATRIDEINGTVVAFSNANPQVYEVWDTDQYHDDSPSDENLPYTCAFAPAYRTLDRRQGLQSFDKAFTEGYITAGTPLTLTVRYNWQGVTNETPVPVNSIAYPAYLFSPSIDSLGDASLGDNPLGDGLDDPTYSEDFVKFKNINSLSQVNCFEYQTVYSSDTADAQWEILAVGTNATRVTDQDATFIINKLR